MKIYILGGGNMGTAMAYGLKNSGFDVIIVCRDKEKLANFKKIGFCAEIYGKSYDIKDKNIILAVKPYALSSVSNLLSGEAKVCISVLARTGIEMLNSSIKAKNYAVCLPNIAAKFNSSVTPFISDGDDNTIVEILNGFGKCVKLETKNELDAASVLAGCAPAYLALVAEALSNAGVLEGLKKDDANFLVNGLFDGFAKLLKSSHPALIKESVCSPAGTTIEGVAKLEECGVRHAFLQAVKASAKKQRS
ncbi:pyrroline-5-carboxylate reductase [Campylobacter fetus]|uniref:Pyrroline-5-carboxylate reductase n=1 Tax=Campylobacter fetus TaxID=196 RepID=A0A5L4L860_CAMFE|nr:pyrroline-5-carboxylate reductase [Campylobacter fetus]EAI4415207.1 pyrroline-5-carboxylate reductase [Campylobacter fetus]EAI5408273.1 pyrroline-5-carboxylate reductase [Campylobacter fetus]EAJ0327447.1 pyrroline-5-carboxylate reductase [Campylobacter fetus]EAJ1230765.1 pyrroline-5-carboxylate reductase [Campylobacter fetus]EAK0416191.1 pyrroline-5-carboxylate reductase [Campylobacter fetus]